MFAFPGWYLIIIFRPFYYGKRARFEPQLCFRAVDNLITFAASESEKHVFNLNVDFIFADLHRLDSGRRQSLQRNRLLWTGELNINSLGDANGKAS